MRHATGSHMQPPNHDRVAGRAAYASLIPEGFAEADRAGQGLETRKYRPERAFSSSLTRALQTAETVLGRLTLPRQLDVIQDSWLDEQCLGGSEGRLRTEVYTPEMLARYAAEGANVRHPGVNAEGIGGQSLNEVVQCELNFMASLRAESAPSQKVFVVGHHSAIKGLVAAVRMMPHRAIDPHQLDPLELNDRMLKTEAITPCSTTLIVADGTPDDLRLRVEYVGQPA